MKQPWPKKNTSGEKIYLAIRLLEEAMNEAGPVQALPPNGGKKKTKSKAYIQAIINNRLNKIKH